MLRTIITFVSLAGAVGLGAGCGDSDDGSADGVTVVASTTEVADLARNVAGDRAEVVGLLAANSDPHDFEPQPSDVEAVADADLVLQSGGDVDLWLDEIVDSSGTGAPVVTLIDSLQTLPGEDEEIDPHWWQDPTKAVAAVETIFDRLVEVDPEGRETYARNTADYVTRLRDLDQQIADCMQSIPEDERKLVTTHDALGYYAMRYEIEVIGAVTGALTTQAQPSAGEVDELVQQIQAEGVSAIFPEAGVDAQLEDAIADETGAVVGAELWADTLGPEGSGGETYLEAMAANTEAVADGFTGRPGTCEISVE